ncbi:MAG: radical SAM protein [Candidatus Brocadiia bacterium]
MAFDRIKSITGRELLGQMASNPAMRHLSPEVLRFFADYLDGEKAVAFGKQHVINSHFPAVPSRAFTRFVERMAEGSHSKFPLYSVTFAITNRCLFECSHCYNAGRSQTDTPLETLKRTADRLTEMGAICVHLTGGEPLLRDDIKEIALAFGGRVSLSVGTTGLGLTAAKVRELRDADVFAVGISLDSDIPGEHNRQRGRDDAFDIAMEGLKIARDGGMYPYFVTVASRELLAGDRFDKFVRFARDAGALEIHVLEPCPVGRLAGHTESVLTKHEREVLLDKQREYARKLDMPIVSTFAYIESPEFFGCGAGGSHLYIDGSGEVCPCQLVPLSFGNICSEPFEQIFERMHKHFGQATTECLGKVLNAHINPQEQLPLSPAKSGQLCREFLSPDRPVARYSEVARRAGDSAIGNVELIEAYNTVHGDYNNYWLSRAAAPIHELVERLGEIKAERVFEAGCGTGYCTRLLVGALPGGASIRAVDISEGMISEARKRLAGVPPGKVAFVCGDALEDLRRQADLDLIVSSWVLGYIKLRPFFEAAAKALKPGGRLAFVVHRENSPREALEIFSHLVGMNPSVLTRGVDFDFPASGEYASLLLSEAGFNEVNCWEGSVDFDCDSPEEAIEHLLKSGAGTVYYEAVAKPDRDRLSVEFIKELRRRYPGGGIKVTHDFVSCIAKR